MLTDLKFEDYADWRSRAERLRSLALLSNEEKQELVKWDTLIEMWLSGMEAASNTPRGSDTEIWRFIEDLDYAGVNAPNLCGVAPGPEALFETPAVQFPQSSEDPEAERKWCLANIVEAFAAYLTVFTLPTDDLPTGAEISFDLSDETNSRSRYQLLSYGELITDLEEGNTPVGGPYEEVRTKPRQVGSTTFWEKLAALLMQCLPRYKVCFQFPLESDAIEHAEKIIYDLKRMHEIWPDRFWSITVAKASKGIIKLANGAELHIRHGGGSGVNKVGLNFNLFVASEAGKYERHSPDAWKTINTAIIPAVHRGPFNMRVWEGTNDELAYELNRIVDIARLPHSNIRFKFFGWTIIEDYVGPPVHAPELSVYGAYADYEVIDGDRKPISEQTYCLKYGLTPEQIGFRRQKIDGLGSLDLFHQEYPITYEESQISGEVKFFPSILLVKNWPVPLYKANFWSNGRVDGRFTPWKFIEVSKDESTEGRWWVWSEPEDTPYVMAGDFSDGVPGGDYTALGVFRVADGVQVAGAKFRGGIRNEIVIADEMAALTAYYGGKNVRVIGELDGPGKAVRSRWIDFNHSNNYHRMLNRKSYDEYTDSMWYNQSTNSSIRAAALLNTRTAIADAKLVIKDERWRFDAEDFVKHKNGKFAGAEAVSRMTGEKVRDDMVMMSSLAWEGIRTHEKYGRAKRFPVPERRMINLDPATEVDALCYGDLQGGLIGRLLDGHTRRKEMGREDQNRPRVEEVEHRPPLEQGAAPPEPNVEHP